MGEVRELSGKTVLVTGASGLVGSAVVRELLSAGASVIAAGRSVARLRSRLGENQGLFYMEYDATWHNDFSFKADYLVLAASPASPNLYVEKPVDVMLSNTVAVNELLSYAVQTKVGKVVYVSSSEVYGRMTPPPTGFKEDRFGEVDIANPRNSYAESKRAAELLCVSYAKQHGIDVSIVRPGHVYGPTATESDGRVSSLWPRMAVRGEPIVMKSEGRQLRSYIHCRDCATAILKVLECGEAAKAYNISNRNSVVTIRQLAETISRKAGVPLKLECPSSDERKAFNPMDNSSLDASRLEALGWVAEYDLEAGVHDTIRELRERMK